MAIDVTAISSTASSFAALKADGSVVTWGNFATGANSSAVVSNIDGKVGVTKIFSTDYAFAALRSDGSVITWGDQTLGGDSSAVSQALNGSNPVQNIYANSTAFLAVHQDNTITTWGFASHGGDSDSVADQFNSNKTIETVAVSQTGFAVLFVDGSFVTWGDFADDDTARISDLTSANNIESISSNNSAFYAIDSSGNTIAWGDLSEGGTYTAQDANSYAVTSTTVTRSGANLSEVTLTITSNGSINTYTTSEAPITTTSTQGSSLSIGASLDYAVSSKAITSQDALDALRLSVGMDTQSGTSTAFDYIAADFNQDGKVSSADALDILKYSVGLATTKEASWKFVDTTANLDSISRSNTSLDEGKLLENLSADTSVSLTGILVGDVNDTYSSLIA